MNQGQVAEIKLSPLDARFIRAYFGHGNATQAAKEAGCKCNSEESFGVRGSQLLKKLNHPIQTLMAEAGLTSLEILRSVANGINAKDIHVEYDKDGNKHEINFPNWHARARFTDIAIKLSGGYPKSQMELPFLIRDGHIVIEAELATNTPDAEQ